MKQNTQAAAGSRERKVRKRKKGKDWAERGTERGCGMRVGHPRVKWSIGRSWPQLALSSDDTSYVSPLLRTCTRCSQCIWIFVFGYFCISHASYSASCSNASYMFPVNTMGLQCDFRILVSNMLHASHNMRLIFPQHLSSLLHLIVPPTKKARSPFLQLIIDLLQPLPLLWLCHI